MKSIGVKIVALIFVLISPSALGQTTPDISAIQILDNSIKFCGGEKRIAAIQSTSLTYLLTQSDQSVAIIEEKRKSGQKYVQSVLSKTHIPQTTFFDGVKMSVVNGSSVNHIDNLETIDEIRLKTYNLIQYGYKKLGYKLTRLQDKKFRNFDCYVVDAEAGNGYITTNFFDKTNNRLLMVVYPNGNKSIMIDYILKDSVLFNSHVVNTFAGSDQVQDLSLQDAEVNVRINDLWFKCPYQDSVVTPASIKIGTFASTIGTKTFFARNDISQDYFDEQAKLIQRRFLKWTSEDTFVLYEEMARRNSDPAAEPEIMVRIISWDEDEYVCHWIGGKYTDTQDYKKYSERQR